MLKQRLDPGVITGPPKKVEVGALVELVVKSKGENCADHHLDQQNDNEQDQVPEGKSGMH
jgi:hypothetical protein